MKGGRGELTALGGLVMDIASCILSRPAAGDIQMAVRVDARVRRKGGTGDLRSLQAVLVRLP